MRIVVFVAIAGIVGANSGCTRYVEMQKAEPRIWIMSQDMKAVYRCVDLVAVDGHGKHVVECIKARIRTSDKSDTDSNLPAADVAE